MLYTQLQQVISTIILFYIYNYIMLYLQLYYAISTIILFYIYNYIMLYLQLYYAISSIILCYILNYSKFYTQLQYVVSTIIVFYTHNLSYPVTNNYCYYFLISNFVNIAYHYKQYFFFMLVHINILLLVHINIFKSLLNIIAIIDYTPYDNTTPILSWAYY